MNTDAGKLERKHHDLKIIEPYYTQVLIGNKTFEIRKNDRNFKVGDTITLRKYDPLKPNNILETPCTEINGIISYVTDYEQKQGYVVFSFKRFGL